VASHVAMNDSLSSRFFLTFNPLKILKGKIFLHRRQEKRERKFMVYIHFFALSRETEEKLEQRNESENDRFKC
jgi:hypothetical protein